MEVYYDATRLSFRSKVFEPLKWDDIIKINVRDEGLYVMTKKEFYETFSNVIKTKSYNDSNYNYQRTPNKALIFLKYP